MVEEKSVSVDTVEPYSVEDVTDGRMTWFEDEDIVLPDPKLKKFPKSMDSKLS